MDAEQNRTVAGGGPSWEFTDKPVTAWGGMIPLAHLLEQSGVRDDIRRTPWPRGRSHLAADPAETFTALLVNTSGPAASVSRTFRTILPGRKNTLHPPLFARLPPANDFPHRSGRGRHRALRPGRHTRRQLHRDPQVLLHGRRRDRPPAEDLRRGARGGRRLHRRHDGKTRPGGARRPGGRTLLGKISGGHVRRPFRL